MLGVELFGRCLRFIWTLLWFVFSLLHLVDRTPDHYIIPICHDRFYYYIFPRSLYAIG